MKQDLKDFLFGRLARGRLIIFSLVFHGLLVLFLLALEVLGSSDLSWPLKVPGYLVLAILAAWFPSRPDYLLFSLSIHDRIGVGELPSRQYNRVIRSWWLKAVLFLSAVVLLLIAWIFADAPYLIVSYLVALAIGFLLTAFR